jgi:hypothetical protein
MLIFGASKSIAHVRIIVTAQTLKAVQKELCTYFGDGSWRVVSVAYGQKLPAADLPHLANALTARYGKQVAVKRTISSRWCSQT